MGQVLQDNMLTELNLPIDENVVRPSGVAASTCDRVADTGMSTAVDKDVW